MNTRATTLSPLETDADTIVVGIFEGDEPIAHDTSGGALSALLTSGEAKRSYQKVALTHADGKRWLLVGLGKFDEFSDEKARVSAALAAKRAVDLGAKSLCWELPHGVEQSAAGAIVEGTLLALFRFDTYKTPPKDAADLPNVVEELIISAHDDVAKTVEDAAVIAQAVNDARVLQNTPGNDMTPTRLGERARELATELNGLRAQVEGRADIIARGMGAFAAVAQGTYEEPALITMHYDGPDASGPVLGFVGKAVTFDTGGISLKPSAAMSEMKFDMSGGAAVLEAVGAIAKLQLPIKLVAVIGATENMPSGRSVKPGDIVTAMNGTTIEINNTDAEGRLVLADCLAHAINEGAERVVDLATLTGAILIALGTTYAGLISSDDDWAAAVEGAAAQTGELIWRLPLHAEYAELVKGKYADLDNAPEGRKAGSITAAEFLKAFVGETPWAHLDIAGTAWDLGRPYADKSGSGFGVRLLVALAQSAS